jgi:hypothetical protein
VTSLQGLSYGDQPGGTSAAEARAAIAQPAPGLALAQGLQGAAFGTGLPADADALAALAGNPNAGAVFAPGVSGDVLGLAVLGAGLAGDADPLLITFTSLVGFQLDLDQLALTQHLVVALLDPEFDGTGFDLLQLSIQREGIDVFTASFTSAGEALTLLDDRVVDLGDIAAGVSGELELSVRLVLTSDDPGAGFRTNLIIGNVPEPATALLLGAGLCALARLGRRGRR